MKKIILLFLSLVTASVALAGTFEDYEADKELFDRICTQCHDNNWFLWPRTYKSWQLTVANMRSYAYGELSFSEPEGECIVGFLTHWVGEGVLLKPEAPEKDVSRAETQRAQSEIAVTTQPTFTLPAGFVHKKKLWTPSRNMLRCARGTGFFAVFCLLGLLGTGFKRKTLKQNFRKYHVRLALGLFLALTVHGVIYIAKYGTPNVTWYWFGLIGFGLLVFTEAQGIIRKKFRKGPLAAHITAACVGLLLSVLHWVWAWI